VAIQGREQHETHDGEVAKAIACFLLGRDAVRSAVLRRRGGILLLGAIPDLWDAVRMQGWVQLDLMSNHGDDTTTYQVSARCLAFVIWNFRDIIFRQLPCRRATVSRLATCLRPAGPLPFGIIIHASRCPIV
jgi:hypothetical protein